MITLRKYPALLLVAVLMLASFALGSALSPSTARVADAQTTSSGMLLTDVERIYADIYNRVSPSVVAISVITEDDGSGNIQGGSGAGFVLDSDGHIVTNFHVVDNAQRIEINFLDGTKMRADVVGTDPDSDLAVLKVDTGVTALFPVTLGDSSQLTIGQMTLALGSPFGQRWTLTSGIVSALDRTISGLSNFSIGGVIQTDAAINPGNSGGPLFNLQGEVIGVNAQISTTTGAGSGIGYSIPSNLVKRVSEELIRDGVVNYSYMGIQGGDVDLLIIEDYNLPANQTGAVVATVVAGGPADRAGLRGSDDRVIEIITAVNGVPMRGFNTLISYLASNTRPGDRVTLTVQRNNEVFTVELELGTRPGR